MLRTTYFPKSAGRGDRRPAMPFEINQQSPQARYLQAWWPLGVQPGDEPNVVAGPMSLSMKNMGGSQLAADVDGGMVRNFVAASSQFLTCPVPRTFAETDMNKGAPMAISAWFRANTVTSDQVIFELANRVNSIGIRLYIKGTTSKLRAAINSSGASALENVSAESSNACVVGQWHFGVAYFPVWTALHVYLDGVRVVNDGGLNNANWDSTFSFATVGVNRGGNSSFFDGHIADLRVYKGTLSDSLIRQMYNSSTRWELYRPAAQVYFFVPAAAEAVISWTPDDVDESFEQVQDDFSLTAWLIPDDNDPLPFGLEFEATQTDAYDDPDWFDYTVAVSPLAEEPMSVINLFEATESDAYDEPESFDYYTAFAWPLPGDVAPSPVTISTGYYQGNPIVLSLYGKGGAGNEVTVPIPSSAPQSLVIQPDLATNSAYFVLVQFDEIPSLLNNVGRIKDGEAKIFMSAGYLQAHLVLADANGILQNGGQDDNVMLRFSSGRQFRSQRLDLNLVRWL